MTMLEGLIPKFRAANPDARERMVKKAADCIKSTWTEEMEFNKDVMISICDLSTKLGYSQSSLAYSRTSVQQS